MSNNDPFRELVEAYALDALDPQERDAFVAHLASGCSDCASALEEARWTVSQLAYLSPDANPSAALKDHLLHTVGQDAVERMQHSRRKAAIPLWMWLGVAALLLVAAYTSWDAAQTSREIQDLQARSTAELQQQRDLQQQLETAKHEAMILTDPHSQKIMLPASKAQMPQLEAMWSPDMGLCVDGQNIPIPSDGRVLQLWLIPKAPGAKPMPSITARPGADGKLMLMVTNPPDLIANTKALAITEEPAGGSAQPTSTPMWVGGVS